MNSTAHNRLAIVVNGRRAHIAAQDLAATLEQLGYDLSWAAVALNEEIVRREDLASTPVTDGDRIEVLSPMSGG